MMERGLPIWFEKQIDKIYKRIRDNEAQFSNLYLNVLEIKKKIEQLEEDGKRN